MKHGYPTKWPIVTQAQFERVMGEFDYCRDGWSDCIVYYDRTGQQKDPIGYEVNGRRNDAPTFRLRPDLAKLDDRAILLSIHA